MSLQRLAIGLLLVAALSLGFLRLHGAAPPPDARPVSGVHSVSDTGTPLWSGGPRAAENAYAHWRKHGRQFPGLHSERDFVAAAHAFVSNPPQGTLEKHRSNGDVLFYDPATNIFAVRARDGAPRTMFKPDDGMAYWNRQ